MKHPTRDELVSLLYDEAPQEMRAALQSHLESCAPCRAQLAGWKRAGAALDSWKLPVAPHRRRTPVVQWAAAAALAALAVVGAVQVRSLSAQVNLLRAELENRPAASNNVELQKSFAEFAQTQDERRGMDHRAVLAALQEFQSRQAEAYAGLRKELETVAVLTEAGLRQAHTEIANVNSSNTDSPKAQKDL
jgi:hypothetical protein